MGVMTQEDSVWFGLQIKCMIRIRVTTKEATCTFPQDNQKKYNSILMMNQYTIEFVQVELSPKPRNLEGIQR